MNDVASGLFGCLVLLTSAWLFWLGAGPSDKAAGTIDADEQAFWDARLRRRHWVSALMAAVGACAIGAGYFGHGRPWLIFWSVTPVFLLGVIAVALWDAFMTRLHFTRRNQEVIREAAQAIQKSRDSV